MRDSFFNVNASEEQMSKGKMVQSSSGLRHSIRARRVVQERDEQRALVEAFNAPVETLNDPVFTDPDAPQWEDLELENTGENRAKTAAMPVVDSARNSPTVRAFDSANLPFLLCTGSRQSAPGPRVDP